MLPIAINILLVIHIIVSLLIVLIVLMQRPKNEGLGAAFGGGATDQLFGAQTTNVLQTITRWLGGAFFVLTLSLSILYVQKSGGRSSLQEKLTAPTIIPAPPAPATPAPAITPGVEGKETLKLELPAPEAGSAPVQPAPLPEVPKVPEPAAPAVPENTPAPVPEPPAPATPAEPAK